MGRPTLRQVDESFAALTIGTVRAIDEAKRQRMFEGLAEREEQLKIEVTGRGEEFPSWAYADIEFETVFVDATGQRDSDFDKPHFYYGAYVPIGGPIGLIACVTRWDTNDRGEVTGCRLAIGAQATDVASNFQGELHAVFQGYGAPADVYDSDSLDVE